MIIKKKYLCIFCGKRKMPENSLINCGHVGMCPDCLSKINFTPHPPLFKGTRNVDYVVSPAFYDGKLRDIILGLKFSGDYAAAEVLSKLMCIMLNDLPHLAEFDCAVPVPLSKKRMTERGYNQSVLLAKPFCDYFGLELREDILFKPRETARQSRLSERERFANVSGSFSASDKARGKRILLIDDIFTTGATMAACADALKAAGAESIAGLTLAIKEKRENIFNRMY